MKSTMKSLTTVILLASTAIAQLTFDNSTGTITCNGDTADKNFCAGDSLTTNIIIRCVGTAGQPGNCNNNLAGQPPIGVKTNALCYQSTNTTGDAACSFNGQVFPDEGDPFMIPEMGNNTTSTSTTTTTSVLSTTTTTSTMSETPVMSGYPNSTRNDSQWQPTMTPPPEMVSMATRLVGVGLVSGLMAVVAALL